MGKRSREKRERMLQAEPRELSEAKEKVILQSSWEKVSLFVIRIGTYLAMFVPLIINTKFFFPFVAPKTILFRMIVEIILAAYLFLVLVNRNYRPRINLLTIAVTLFLAIFILTSLTGVNLGRSFWSTNERMTGIWTMLHLYVFFIVLFSCFKKRDDWERLFSVSVLAGVILSFYVLKGSELSTRGGGTIGNTSFMAAYLLFDIFFAAILLLPHLFKKAHSSVWQTWFGASYALIIAVILSVGVLATKATFSISHVFFWFITILSIFLLASVVLLAKKVSLLFWQIFAISSLIPMLWILFISSARGAVNSFLIGLFLLLVSFLIFSGKQLLKRAILVLVIGLIAASVVLAFWRPPFIQNTTQSLLREMESRFAVWGSAWQGFLDRPILGWGPENFNVVFLENFNPCMFSRCGGEIWFDRSHDVIFDTLSNSGTVGLISYLAIFIVAVFSLLKVIPKISDKRNILVPLLLADLLIVYFIQNLFVFDMINTYLVLFLSLAFIAFVVSNREEPAIGRGNVNPFLGFLILLLTAAFLWLGNIKPAVANHYLIKALMTQDVTQSSDYFQKSLSSSWMNKYEVREQLAQSVIRATYQRPDNATSFTKSFELAAGEMEKSVQENSLDFRPYLFLAQLYTNYYRWTGDTEKINRAEDLLIKGISLSPDNQQGYWNLAEAKIAQGKTGEAVPLLQHAIELEPGFARSYWYLGMAYQVAGQYELAAQNVAQSDKLGYNWKDNINEINRVIGIYNFLQDDEGLVNVLLSALNLDPNNTQYLMQLAAAHANLGQYDKAREMALKAASISPGLNDKVQEFLNQLPR